MNHYIYEALVIVTLVYSAFVIYATLLMRHRLIKPLGRITVYISQIVTLMNAAKSITVWGQLCWGLASFGWGVLEWVNFLKASGWAFTGYGTLWLPSIALAFGVTVLANQLRPAGIFLLGKSTAARLHLQDRMNKELFGIRTVSLLNQEGSGEWALASGHSFRTDVGRWEKSVEDFARVIGVIVLDHREGTDLVELELKILRRFNLGYKTLVISSNGSGGECHFESTLLPNAKIVESEDEVLSILRQLFLLGIHRVSREHPFTSWA